MFPNLVSPGSLRAQFTFSAPERYSITAVSLSRPLTSLNAARATPSISTRKLKALKGSSRCGAGMIAIRFDASPAAPLGSCGRKCQTGTVTAVGDAIEIDEAAFRGQVVRPADPDYDLHRSIWNGSIDKRPAMIVRCAGVADVIAAVKLGRASGLPVAVRS